MLTNLSDAVPAATPQPFPLPEATPGTRRAARTWDQYPDAVVFVDPEGLVIDANPTVETVLGCPRERLIGEAFKDAVLAPGLPPARRDILSGFLPPAAEALRHGRVELPAQRPNGEHVTLEATVVADEEGFMVFLRDVTARTRDEERLRLLESVAVHARDSILITEAEPVTDPGPKILYVNEAFTRLMGYTAEEVIGKSPRILQGPGTDPEAKRTIRKALRAWKPVVVEVLNYRKDGSELWEELSIVPVADRTGWYTHWVSIQRDITERKRSEAVIRKAKEEAEKANHAKSEFLSRMSHELRTPLNAILGFAQLLEEELISRDSQESVHQILTAGRHLLGLINEVLDISRIESGRLALSMEAVSVAEAVGEALDVTWPLATSRRVTFCATPCHRYVLADQQRLKQVLLNLVSNAIKYNREDGTVAVTCEPVTDPAGGSRLRIAVSDTGRGIPPEQLPRLFQPFERLDAERSAVEGIGLGLAVSKRLVELMGGVIGVKSTAGVGSTFWFDLAQAPSPLPDAEVVSAPPDAADPAVPDARLLLVEDNLSNLRLVQRILQRRPQVKLLAAMRGEEGLASALEHRPDAILLDLHLPDMHGRDVMDRLRLDPRTANIPIVIISADATPSQAERMLARGASAYLTKPLDVAQFIEVLDRTLGACAP